MRKRIVWISGLALSLGMAQAQTETPALESSSASCVVAIWADAEVLPLNEGLLVAILESDGVAPRAARNALQLESDMDVRESYSLGVEAVGATGRGGFRRVGEPLLVRLEVQSMAAPFAPAMLREACRLLEGELAALSSVHEQSQTEHIAGAEQAVARLNQRVDEIIKRREELRARSGKLDLRSSAIQDLVADTEESLRELDMELAGMQAREQALVDQIKQVNDQAQAALDQELTEVSQRMAARLELLEQRADRIRLLTESGHAPPAELEQVMEERAEMMAQLDAIKMQARQRQSQATGSLVTNLRELAVESAATQAQQARLAQVLAQVREQDLIGVAEKADQLERELREAQGALAEARLEAEKLAASGRRGGGIRMQVIGD